MIVADDHRCRTSRRANRAMRTPHTGAAARTCATTRGVRVLVAHCSVKYEGRLGARLPAAPRLLILKADGSIAVHADAKAYKPLNWMSPPCTIARGGRPDRRDEPEGRDAARRAARGAARPQLRARRRPRPGEGRRRGRAAGAARPSASPALREDLRLVRREYPTDIGPVDLLCRDGDDRAVVVEVKRVGEIAGVEQLLRYQERLDLDPQPRADHRACSSRPASSRRRRCSPRAAACCAWRSTSTSCAAGAPLDLRLF